MASWSLIQEDLKKLKTIARRKALKVFFSFFFFCLVYLFLLSVSIIMVWMVFRHGYVLLGGGLPGILSFLALVFLSLSVAGVVLRFLIVRFPEEDKKSIEINQTINPALMNYIYSVCDEINAPRPAMVFISMEVNAFVSGHHGIKSILKPNEKNLTIGYPLLLHLNKSEFRATLAHEFGHFSNDSLLPGRFLSRIHRGVHAMIFSRGNMEEWTRTLLQSRGIANWIGAGGASLRNMVRGIFASVYEQMHFRYMALSRVNELSADKIAAVTAGGEALCSALRKMDFITESMLLLKAEVEQQADKSRKLPADYWALTVSFMSWRLKKENIFLPLHEQSWMENLYSSDLNMDRVQTKNSWQSHPSFEERKENVSSLFKLHPADFTPCISLLENRASLEKKLNNRLYDLSGDNSDLKFTAEEEYTRLLQQSFDLKFGEKKYKGYFDFRFLILHKDFVPARDLQPSEFIPLREEDLAAIKRSSGLQRDINSLLSLRSVHDRYNAIYEFDGGSCRYEDIEGNMKTLEEEDRELAEHIQLIDERMVDWHYSIADEKNAAELKQQIGLYLPLVQLRSLLHMQLSAFASFSFALKNNKAAINAILSDIRSNLRTFEKERLDSLKAVLNAGTSENQAAHLLEVKRLLAAHPGIDEGRYNLAKFKEVNSYLSILGRNINAIAQSQNATILATMSRIAGSRVTA